VLILEINLKERRRKTVRN